MKMKEIIPESDLDKAAEELYNAVYKYREFLKRNYRDRLAGVIWLRRGNEVVVFSENGKYTEQVCRLTWDSRGDSFSLIECKREYE